MKCTYSMTAVAAVLGGIAVLSCGCNKDKGKAADAGAEADGAICTLDGDCGPDAAAAGDAAAGEIFQLPSATDLPPETVLAKVGDIAFTVADADAEITRRFGNRANPDQLREILAYVRPQAVGNFVAKTLLEQEIARQGVEATDEEIDAKIAEMVKANPLPEGMTLEQAVEAQGGSMKDFREDMAMMTKLEKMVAKPDEEALAAFYEEHGEAFLTEPSVTARHILVKVDEGDTDEQKAEKKAKIEAIRQKLVDGADFAELAAQESDCPSKARGGDLGSFPRGQMVPEFDAAAFAQEIGAIGEIVETAFGFHVIQVTARDEGGKKPFEEVKEDISNLLRSQAFQKLQQDLRKAAKIEFHESIAGMFAEEEEAPAPEAAPAAEAEEAAPATETAPAAE